MIEKKISALIMDAQEKSRIKSINKISYKDIRKQISETTDSAEKRAIRLKYFEKRLYEKEHLFEQMERHAEMGFWEFNLHTGETYWTDGLYRLLDMQPHEISPEATTLLNYSVPDNRNKAHDAFLRLLDTGEPHTIETRLVLPSGKTLYVSLSNEIIKDELGAPVKISGSVMNITKRKQAQHEDKKSKSLYKDLIDNLPIGVAQVDDKAIFRVINKKMAESLGAHPKEITGRHMSEFMPKEIFENRFNTGIKALEKMEPVAFEDSRDGKIFSNLVIPKVYDNQVFAQIISADITKERFKTKALAESESRFRQFVEDANDIIYSIDLNGNFTYISPNIKELLGYTQKELLHASSTSIIHPDERRKVEKTIEQIAVDKQKTSDLQYRVKNKNGVYLWHTSNSSPVFDSAGNIIGINGISRNIHELKTTEEELINSKKTLKNYIDEAPYGIFVIEEDGTCAYSNKEAARIAKREDIDITSKNFFDFILPKDRMIALDNFEKFKKNQKEAFITRFGTQELTSLTVTVKPIKINDDSYVIYTNDITIQKKKSEKIKAQNIELQELNSTKDKFFSIIAHDIKNPFTNLLGFAQLLEHTHDKVTTEKRASHIKHMHQSAKNVYSLLENLLTWSRLKRNKLQQEITQAALRPSIQDNIMLMEDLAAKKGIEINFPEKADIKVEADINMLQTVLRNLLSNAIKFTPEHGKITVDYEKNQEGKVVISVKDTGIGMTDEQQNLLFKIDKSFNRQGTHNEEGTGLGLILCKEFVKKNNGEIWVESEEGKGSTFSFTVWAV